MSHPRSTLHWIQFRLESKTNHIGRWHSDDGFMSDDDDIWNNKHPLLPVVAIWGSAVVAFVATYVVGWTNPWKANRVPSRAIIPCRVPNRFFPVLFFQLTRDLILPYIILLSFPEDTTSRCHKSPQTTIAMSLVAGLSWRVDVWTLNGIHDSQFIWPSDDG